MDMVHAIYPIYGNNSGKPLSHIECITRNKTMAGMKHEIIYECLAINPIAITSGIFCITNTINTTIMNVHVPKFANVSAPMQILAPRNISKIFIKL